MKDSFYTSSNLAATLLNYTKSNTVRHVADFCVGGGDLLLAAKNKFCNSICYGYDISSSAIDRIKDRYTDWITLVCDFLLKKDRMKIYQIRKDYDLILLNPPFTCKGNKAMYVKYRQKEVRVSTAMAFLLPSLEFLNQESQILVIMPVSSIYSEKDSLIWNVLSDNYKIELLMEKDNACFENCAPSIALLSITHGKSNHPVFPRPVLRERFGGKIEVLRGKLPVYKACRYLGKYKYIHTTNLINHSIKDIKYYVNYPSTIFKGPLILFPRVGNPSIQKVCLIKTSVNLALSDCVIAVKSSSLENLVKLYNAILEYWDDFSSLYKGTGAKYITMKAINLFFDANIHIDNRS